MPRIIGILGGMGPLATADLYQKIIRATPATCDQDQDTATQQPGQGRHQDRPIRPTEHLMRRPGALVTADAGTRRAFQGHRRHGVNITGCGWANPFRRVRHGRRQRLPFQFYRARVGCPVHIAHA